MKRQPTLADMFLATKYESTWKHSKRTYNVVRDKLIEAKRFVLDDAASRYLGEMQRDLPEAIAFGQEFALPPFPLTWVEFNSRIHYEALTGRVPDADSDFLLGFLINWPSAYVIANATDEHGRFKDALLSPMKYKLFQPFDHKSELEFCETIGISRFQLDAFFWGESLHKMMADIIRRQTGLTVGKVAFETDMIEQLTPTQTEFARSLRANHSVEIIYDQHRDEVRQTFMRMFQGSAGELRILVALLLLLNRSSKVTYLTELGPKQQMIRNKPRTLLKHSVITFKLNPIPKIKRLGGKGGGLWRRRHDVRAHFCHDKTARNASCMHDWEEQAIEQWRCLQCGGLKWRRKAHSRGHLEKGDVVAGYQVTA